MEGGLRRRARLANRIAAWRAETHHERTEALGCGARRCKSPRRIVTRLNPPCKTSHEYLARRAAEHDRAVAVGGCVPVGHDMTGHRHQVAIRSEERRVGK